MKLRISEILECTGGTLLAANEEETNRIVEGLTWDSREVTAGKVFVALPGERVDGNDFIVKAVLAGAGCIICTRDPKPNELAMAGEFTCPIIQVADGVAAVGAVASLWRSRLRGLVIGVTGSCGKTSTKDMLKSVLSQRFSVSATEGNHNNELGVPLTILNTASDCEILIVEMGMRGLGQIKQLCDIARPTVGIVTNVGVCHLELLGSRENIAQAKSELIASLPPTGLAVVCGDDDMTSLLLEKADALVRGVRVCRFGVNEGNFTHVSNLAFDSAGKASFDLAFGQRDSFHLALGMPGKHNVVNALSVACVADHLGLSPEMMAAGFAQEGSSKMRMEIVKAANGITFINDAYNANPSSMAAALDTLAGMSVDGRRVAILGDMGELGSDEASMHAQVGEHAATSNLDLLVCVGELSANIAQGAADAGFAKERIVAFNNLDDCIDSLSNLLEAGDTVLVKASRFMGLERVISEMES